MIDRDAIQYGDEVTWLYGSDGHEGLAETRSRVAYTVQTGCAVFNDAGAMITVPWRKVIAHHPKGETACGQSS